MKKIAFVIPWFADNIPGGAEAELRGIVKHLSARKVDVEILTTCAEQFLSDWNINYYKEGTDTASDVTVRRFPVRKSDKVIYNYTARKLMDGNTLSRREEDIFMKEMINSPKLYEYIEKNKDNYSLFIFIPYMFGTTYYGCQICPEKSVIIPCFHDEIYVYMECFKEPFSKVKGMIFHAKAEYELAAGIYDLSNVDAKVLGESVDTDITFDSSRFRRTYRINDNFILYAGRKDVGKNVDVLINYFCEFKKRNPGSLKLVLIGGGEVRIPQHVKNDIIDLGFVPVQDKYDAYSTSLFLCQPSLNESFSIVIMESWLCNRPVLVHEKCPVTKEFAIESNGGLYFSGYYDFEGCTNYFLLNPEAANIMGKNGYNYVTSNFSRDVVLNKYIEYFKQVCA